MAQACSDTDTTSGVAVSYHIIGVFATEASGWTVGQESCRRFSASYLNLGTSGRQETGA